MEGLEDEDVKRWCIFSQSLTSYISPDLLVLRQPLLRRPVGKKRNHLEGLLTLEARLIARRLQETTNSASPLKRAKSSSPLPK